MAKGKRKRARADGKTDTEVLTDLIQIRDEQISWVIEVQISRDDNAIGAVFGALEKALDRVERQQTRMGIIQEKTPELKWLPYTPDIDAPPETDVEA